jgi:hypothetical protein
VQTDPEHQQDHTDLSEFGCNLGVADNPRRVGTNQHTGDEIATIGESPSRLAINPKSNAALSASAIVVIKGISCMTCPRLQCEVASTH